MDDPRVAIHSLVRRNLGPAKPVKAKAAYVGKSMHPQEAFRATLSDCLAQIAANAATLRNQESREHRSVEGLHQLRVAFRRLEVALGAFGREFRQGWLEELRGRAKILAARMAPARDLDVFVAKLRADRAEISKDALAALRARAEIARDAAWDAALACITSADFELFTDDVAGLAQSQLPLTQERRLSKMARRMLDRQMKRVTRRGKTARSREEGDLHRLRIALKKLRYTAEFFAPLYPKKDVKRYLKTLRGLQNQFGELNDIANVRGVVGALMRDTGKKAAEPAACFAAGAVTGWYGARTPRVIKQVVKRYKKFRRVEPFWH